MPANYYWAGNTSDDFTDKKNWTATAIGGGVNSAPGPGDDVFITSVTGKSPTVPVGGEPTVGSITITSGRLQINGSLTIHGTTDSTFSGGEIQLATSSSILDIQCPLTWSSSAGFVPSLNPNGTVQIDQGGAMNVTGGAKTFATDMVIGGNGSGTVKLADLNGNLLFQNNAVISVATGGYLNFAQANNSGTAGGIDPNSSGSIMIPGGLVERTVKDANADTLTIGIDIMVEADGNNQGRFELDPNTSVNVPWVLANGGVVELGNSSSLTTANGVQIYSAGSVLMVDGAAAGNSGAIIEGSLTVNAGQVFVGLLPTGTRFTTLYVDNHLSLQGGTVFMDLNGGGVSGCDQIITNSFFISNTTQLDITNRDRVAPTGDYILVTAQNAAPGGGEFGTVVNLNAPNTTWYTRTIGKSSIISIEDLTASTMLQASTNPASPGQAVTFTATVTPPPSDPMPTGIVDFYDGNGATFLGSASLTAAGSVAQATFTASAFSLGSHNITAVYEGDANYGTITSSVLTETVQQAATTTALSESVATSSPGQAVIFTAAVSSMIGTSPTGVVKFFDNYGATLLGSGTLSHVGTAFQATFSDSALALGSHSITAVYQGDAADAGSTSPALTEIVAQPAASVSLSASTLTSTAGQAVTFTATVTPPPSGATPTGSVTFYDGSTSLGTLALTSAPGGAQAAFTTSTLGVGSHNITAVYGGDTTYAGATSSAVTETVQASSPTASVSLSSSSQTPMAGQSINLTATVTPAPNGAMPTGSVIFYDNGTSLGTVALSPYMGMGGQAVLTTSALSVGSHSVTAVYSGDSHYTSGTSPAVSETVQQASVMLMESSSNSSALFGQAVTFTGTIMYGTQGVAPTGTIAFYDGNTLLGTVSVSQVGSNYQASFTTAALGRGSHTIRAVYSGDQDYSTASASLSQTIS